MRVRYTITGFPEEPGLPQDSALFTYEIDAKDKMLFMHTFRSVASVRYPGWSWQFFPQELQELKET